MIFVIVALIYLILIFYLHKYLLNNHKDDIDNIDETTYNINHEVDNHVNKIELEEFINNI